MKYRYLQSRPGRPLHLAIRVQRPGTGPVLEALCQSDWTLMPGAANTWSEVAPFAEDLNLPDPAGCQHCRQVLTQLTSEDSDLDHPALRSQDRQPQLPKART